MRRVSVRTLGVLLCSVGSAGLGVGCSGKDVSLIEQANAPAAAGQLQLALSTRSASGNLYRLRQALFQVSQQDSPFGGFSALLSSEQEPLSTTLEATVPSGDYAVDLFGGWFLEKVQGGEVTRVEAILVSSSTQFVTIRENEESVVSFRFQTNGEIIDFSEGRLIVEIEVEEVDGGPPPDPGVPGDPLTIVDGTIALDSNPHGIEATLFTAVSPQGSSIQVTNDTGSVCVQGTLDVVENGDFGNQWGALFAFAFTEQGSVAAPWDLDGGNVVGFSFTVSGPLLPPLRFGALPGSADPNVDNFCTTLPVFSEGTFEVPFSSITRDCWQTGGEVLAPSDLQTIIWTLPADPTLAHPYDFCVSNVRPLLRSGPLQPTEPPPQQPPGSGPGTQPPRNEPPVGAEPLPAPPPFR
ncbi:MAG TPA: hypothetical protein VJU61_29275 [Polyangiaceae bacterium]|nr:hypothetical protein [Polyangiaceae bacterium]